MAPWWEGGGAARGACRGSGRRPSPAPGILTARPAPGKGLAPLAHPSSGLGGDVEVALPSGGVGGRLDYGGDGLGDGIGQVCRDGQDEGVGRRSGDSDRAPMRAPGGVAIR